MCCRAHARGNSAHLTLAVKTSGSWSKMAVLHPPLISGEIHEDSKLQVSTASLSQAILDANPPDEADGHSKFMGKTLVLQSTAENLYLASS